MQPVLRLLAHWQASAKPGLVKIREKKKPASRPRPVRHSVRAVSGLIHLVPWPSNACDTTAARLGRKLLVASLRDCSLTGVFQKLHKTGVGKRGGWQLIGQQRRVNFGKFIGAVVTLKIIDGQQAHHQCNQ